MGQTTPRILIVKLSAIGDVVHAMPVASALRAALPNAHLGWLVTGPAAALLREHPALDAVIEAPRRFLKSAETKAKVRDELASHRFEISIDLQGLTKSAAAAKLSGAPRRLGFAGSIFKDLGRWFNNDLFLQTIGRETSRWLNNERVHVDSSKHVVEQYLQMLGPLGIERPEVAFGLPAFPEQREAVLEAIGQDPVLSPWLDRSDVNEHGGSGLPLAVLCAAASKPSKLWPSDRFAAVARHLQQQHGLRSVVTWHGDRERERAQAIIERSEGAATLAPPLTLPGLCELFRLSRLCVGSDTGPLHLAAAVGARCVGMFSLMPPSRQAPYGEGNVAIQKLLRRGSSRQRHQSHNREMLAISADDVCEGCDTALRQPPRESASSEVLPSAPSVVGPPYARPATDPSQPQAIARPDVAAKHLDDDSDPSGIHKVSAAAT